MSLGMKLENQKPQSLPVKIYRRELRHIHNIRVNLIHFVLAQAMFPPVAFCAYGFPKTVISIKQIHFDLQEVFEPFRLGDAYWFCALGEFIQMVR